MDLPTLITIVAIIFCAYHVGEYLALSYGVLGWLIGLVIGGSIPLLIRKGLILFLRIFFSTRPLCKNGTCDVLDYKIIEYIEKDQTVILRCKCGIKYVHRSPYFMELLDDGTTKPYMKNIWGIWKLDKGEDLKTRDGL